MSLARHLFLRERQGFTRRHAELPFNEIGPSDELGHGMLHLQPCIHLHEEELVVLHEKLNGSRAYISDSGSEGHRRLSERLAVGLTQTRCRRFLDDLLMTSLCGTVPFEQMNAMTVVVGEHLDLDVTGMFQVALEQQPIIAKRR